MGHQKHGSGHAGQSGKQHPGQPPPEKQKNADGAEKKSAIEPDPTRKRFGMTRFEWTISVLTLAGLVIAGLTGVIFRQQLKEMRTDQRAWVSLSAGNVSAHRDQSAQSTITVPITISNQGKTAARAFMTSIVVEKVRNGQSPRLRYDGPRTIDSAGVIAPNTPFSIEAALLERDPSDKTGVRTRDRMLSSAEYQELLEGYAYLAIYAYSTYDDIFGAHHWHKYCVFVSPAQHPVEVTAKACTDYNDVDDN